MADFLYTYWLAQGSVILWSFGIAGAITTIIGAIGIICTLDSSCRKNIVARTLVWLAIFLIGLLILSVPAMVPSPARWHDAQRGIAYEANLI